MNKKEISTYMEVRDDNTTYTTFTDKAPEELKNLFFNSNECEKIDYEIWYNALNILQEMYDNNTEVNDETIRDNCNDIGSVMTAYRLSYISNYNEDEIYQVLKEYNCTSISQACAYWYCNEVENACILINGLLLKTN